MKNFKYKHSVLVYALLAVVFIVTVIGCAFSIKSAITTTLENELFAFIALAAINLFLALFVLLVALFSKYKLKNGKLKLIMGVANWTILLDEITSLTHLIDSKKLIANLTDGKYIFIVISPEQIDSFIKAVKEANPEIVFDINYSDISRDNKKN
jgi:hypothetical protein